jgi:alkylation response protein AidB-like acyl-CoA dehydrogenase
MTALAPTATLETLFGDQDDPANPLGHEALAAADDRGEALPAAEALLDSWGMNAEFVPVALGGRLHAVDELVRRLRPVFRRDAGLGLGHGLTSLMAALPVWAAGSPAQRAALAGRLLVGEKVSVAFHELAHGNDLTANALRADPAAGGYRLRGAKQVVNNAGRASAAVVFARTGDRPGREHSLLLVDDLDAPAVRRLPRFRTSGLAGSRLAGFAFDDHPVAADRLVGEEGAGAATALRAFQVSRVVTAGAGTSLLEESLAAVLRFAHERRLYGRPVAAIPHARSLLAGAYADLHLAQALTRAAARALHVEPRVAGRWAAAAKYLAPTLVEDAIGDLAVVLGARSYLREGPYAVVARHLRDIAGLSIGHAGGVSCLLTVLPELPGLAPDRLPDPRLLTDAPLPALDLGALRLHGGRADPLLALLLASDAPAAAPLRAAATRLLADAAALPAAERGVTAGHRALALADRYAWCLAAASCLDLPGAGPLLARAGHRAGLSGPPRDSAADTALLAELDARTAAGLSLDLHPDPVARGA